MTHYEYCKKKKKDRGYDACTPHHLTFGGKCLNCGYDPKKFGIDQWGKKLSKKNPSAKFPRWDVLGRRFYDGDEAMWFAKQKALTSQKKVPVRQQDDGWSPSFELVVVKPEHVRAAYDLSKNPRKRRRTRRNSKMWSARKVAGRLYRPGHKRFAALLRKLKRRNPKRYRRSRR